MLQNILNNIIDGLSDNAIETDLLKSLKSKSKKNNNIITPSNI